MDPQKPLELGLPDEVPDRLEERGGGGGGVSAGLGLDRRGMSPLLDAGHTGQHLITVWKGMGKKLASLNVYSVLNLFRKNCCSALW